MQLTRGLHRRRDFIPRCNNSLAGFRWFKSRHDDTADYTTELTGNTENMLYVLHMLSILPTCPRPGQSPMSVSS